MARRRTAGVRARMQRTSFSADLGGHPRVGAPEQQARGLLSRHARLPVLKSVGEKGARRFASVVRGETLRAPIVERHYPPEYLSVYQQIGPSRGVPRFLLTIDGKVRLSAFGIYRYDEIFLPILKQVAERRANQS